MKPFLLISTRPEDSIAEEELETFLRFTGLEPDQLRQLRLEKGPEVARELQDLDLDEISGIFVGGSPFTTSTPQAEKTEVQVRVEKDLGELLDRVMDRGTPFFGACYGVGTLGVHQGGVVDGTYAEGVGPIRITVTDEGSRDVLLEGMPETFWGYVGHQEAVRDLPSNAVLLATGEECPVQMFRIGERAWATQFHPELDDTALLSRIDAYKNHGYFRPEDAEEVRRRVIDGPQADQPRRLLARFAEVFAR